MPAKPYPTSSPLPTTIKSPKDNPPLAGPHISTPPPPQPHQQRQLRRSLRTVPSDMFSPPPPNPSSPPPPPPPVARFRSSASDAQHYSPPPSTATTTTSSSTNENGNDDGPYRDSLSVQPLAVSRPRPDSTILPGSGEGDSLLLDPRHFTAVVRRGETVQYWLPVELVIRGQPGRRCVPEGHWERLVELAEDVSVCTNTSERSGNVQLVTAWCHARELARNVDYNTTRD